MDTIIGLVVTGIVGTILVIAITRGGSAERRLADGGGGADRAAGHGGAARRAGRARGVQWRERDGEAGGGRGKG